MSIAQAAAAYIDRLGVAVVRIPAGSKAPTHNNWQKPGGYWQDSGVAELFLGKHPMNIGAVLGPSNLVSLDIDDVDAAATVLSEFGVDIYQLRDTHPTVQGNPARFRVMFQAPAEALTRHALNWPNRDDADGSKYREATTRLQAARANGDAQGEAEAQADQQRYRKFTVFELRAGDVQDVLPPSIHPETGKPYVWLTKPQAAFPPLPAELLTIWRQWDIFKRNAADLCPWAPKAPAQQPRERRAPVESDGESPIDAFNAAHSIEATLEHYGYKQVGRRYLSPHSGTGLPGVNVFPKDNKASIHHASDPLCQDETGQPVAPFDLFCHYEHNGDVSKAVKAAAKLLGLTPKKREAPPAPPPPQLAKPAPEPKPSNDNTARQEPVDDDEPFRVLGYDRDKFFIFQNEKRQLVIWTKADMTETGLLSIAPTGYWMTYFPGANTPFDRRTAVDWLMRECYKAGVYDPTRVRGRGAWMDEGRVVFHYGTHLSVDGEDMNVTAIRSRFVYEVDRELAVPADRALTDAEGAQLASMATRFRWSKPASAALLSGFVALAPLCGALRWRPHIWITGGAGCGKTTVLNEYVHRLMGGMDLYAQGNSTEAGIRQTLRTDAIPVLFDESEQNDEREANRVQNVLSLIRQASTESSAKTLKGTAGGSSMSFIVRSMFCLSSIQVGMKHQADVERLTVLALRPKREDPNAAASWAALRDQLYMLERDEDLPARLFRRSLELLPTTLQNIKTFVDAAARKFGSVREGDQYGTLLAGCWSLSHSGLATTDDAAAMIEEYDWTEYRENLEVEESTKALGALMEAQVRIGTGGTATLWEIIRAATGGAGAGLALTQAEADALLQRYGMRIAGDDLLLSNTSTAVAGLLRGSPYAADVRGQLMRVQGVRRHDKTVRFNGTASKCLAVPLSIIMDAPHREGPPF